MRLTRIFAVFLVALSLSWHSCVNAAKASSNFAPGKYTLQLVSSSSNKACSFSFQNRPCEDIKTLLREETKLWNKWTVEMVRVPSEGASCSPQPLSLHPARSLRLARMLRA